MAQVLRNNSSNFEVKEKQKAVDAVFSQYDTQGIGELTPVQVQIIHGDMRIGGISFPQVLASMEYVCATEYCSPGELFDLLQEMDRRYFLLQGLRWDFSFLDRLQSDSITVEQAKWMVQSVHGRYFSPGRWAKFVRSRAVPTSGIAFAEIEVMLCDIPSKQSLEEEEKEKERILKEKKKRQAEKEKALLLERQRRKAEAEEARKKRQEDREKAEQERIRREQELDRQREDAIANQTKRQEEEQELERLRRLEEEQRKQREREDSMYRDAEKYHEESKRALGETDEELARLARERQAADNKSLEEEENRLRDLRKKHNATRIRFQLKVAIKAADRYKLEYSVKEFEEAKLEDTDMDLEKAKRLLQQFGARDGLMKAMSKREISDLEKAMSFVRTRGFELELSKEMKAASTLLLRLRRVERIRHEILELKQATVAEIRSYQSPPPIVHTVMTATFLLLGHRERETKDWKEVQALVGKTGKESLKRRCLGLDVATLPEQTAKRAHKLLGSLELDEVRDISAGAATFFVWASTMIEEALDKEDPVEPSSASA